MEKETIKIAKIAVSVIIAVVGFILLAVVFPLVRNSAAEKDGEEREKANKQSIDIFIAGIVLFIAGIVFAVLTANDYL